MAARKITQARMLVRYGEYRTGDMVKGSLAATLVKRGMAKDMTPSPKRSAKKKKAEGAAPENKAFNAEA